MRFSSLVVFAVMGGIAAAGPSCVGTCAAYAQAATPTRVVGSVTAVGSDSLTLKPDNGAPVTIAVADDARILETQPGAKTLAGATKIPLSGIAVGDRVLAAVGPGASAGSLTAKMLICMKQSAIAERQQAEEAAWKREGVAGLVKSVDAATGTIVIASGPKTITVNTTSATTFRRYSADSIKFADTTASTIAGIQAGDQLRARGPHAPGATELTADAVVSGTFRNIAATVLATDAAANTVTVRDLKTKKPVVIHINADSQLHRLPDAMAKELAARFKKGGGENAKASWTGPKGGAANGAWQKGGGAQASDNLSQMLSQTPVIQIADLHKGEAVMIVATEGTAEAATAVALVAGVEPILRASPSASQSVFSASWNVGGGSQAEAGAGTP